MEEYYCEICGEEILSVERYCFSCSREEKEEEEELFGWPEEKEPI